jgi:HAD superfamily hydrolase (TIGR01509 family)
MSRSTEAASGIQAALIDVGGTLWPEDWTSTSDAKALRETRLRSVLPALPPQGLARLVKALQQAAGSQEAELEQDTDKVITVALQRAGVATLPVDLAAIRAAMCLPAASRISLFPNALDLLAAIRRASLRCIVVTNAIWRDQAAYQRDFDQLGIAPFIDAIFSSVDVGFRKPHPAIYEAAIAASGSTAEHCVMIGNSERNDIEPARALGMRTIRVAIVEPLPRSSHAHALSDSLLETAHLIRRWTTAPVS